MNHVRHLFCLAAIATLAGCGSEPDQSSQTTTEDKPKPSASAPAAAPADPTEKMARAVGTGKPGAAVDIKYEFASRPEVGRPVELNVALIPSAGVDSMDVTFGGMDGITLAGSLMQSFSEVRAGEPHSHALSVLPDRNGVFYISASVSTQIGGASLTRAFSIPFVVGSAPVQQKTAPPATDASGQPVEPMQAEETTR
jgi:hypothetical protein